MTRAARLAPLLAGVSALAVALGGCSAGTTADPAVPPAAAPAPDRPAVSLAFDVTDDLRTVRGTERVVFTPDAPLCELVFRAWPNAPTSSRAGSSLTVDTAAVDGRPVPARTEAAGAPSGAPGTLVTLPLAGCVPAGTTITADLGFTLGLGADADDRLGTSERTRTAWFGSGYPMLAWVRGQGWSRTPAATIAGENAVSEQNTLRSLDVTAPADLAVSGVGRAGATAPGPRPATTTHRFDADAVRDVAVAVGRYRTLERTVGPDGTRLHLLTPAVDGTRVPPGEWAERFDASLRRLAPLFGPLPTADLWVAIAPTQSSGIEFPGALQFGDTRESALDSLVAHELAHQWFYALVGNDQGRYPWIDEAFATYAEALASGRPDEYGPEDVLARERGRLGAPMTTWNRFDAYESAVYVQGAAALLGARRDVGAEAFDRAVRTYLAVNAHRVVGPDDVARAFADLPGVRDRLTAAGAFTPRS